MKLRIAYDYQAFALTPYGGISRYLYEVSQRISKAEDCEVKIAAGLHINRYLRNSYPGIVVGKRVEGDILGMTMTNNFYWSKWWLSRYRPNILHETYYNPKNIAPIGCRTIVTVHDMIHEKFQHLMNMEEKRVIEQKRISIQRADHIICVSNNTKQDLLSIIDVDPAKVSVVYHGASLDPHHQQTAHLPFSYLLYVGARHRYKNFTNLLQTYAKSSNLKNHFKLVCFGGSDFSPAEKIQIHELGILDTQVIYIGGDDQLLSNLYNHATAFIYPSLYEGFGIPPIEAMRLNCPVICSNAGSIPEVVAEAGKYFNPNDIPEMIEVIENVVFDETIRQDLIKKGREREKVFSWERCANETYDVYQQLANS
jgi:glycosyltransferase involved in cell wall biosynthesis